MSPHRKFPRYDPRRYIRWVDGRLRDRGLFLSALGIVCIIIGLNLLFDMGSDAYPMLDGPRWWSLTRGVIWTVCGVGGIYYAFQPLERDWIGWRMVLVPVLYRLLAYTHGFMLWFWPGASGDASGGSLGFAAYGFMLVVILRSSRMTKAPRVEGDD